MRSEPTLPPAPSRGDRVAVVSPASGGPDRFPHPYERGLRVLRDRFDLEPVAFPTALKSSEWLYEHPEARARDVMDAFRDPDVGAVLATIGGNDQVRVLKHLDPDVLRANATRFFGTSDNTHLHSLLWREGLISFYGGDVMTALGTAVPQFDYAADYLERALFTDSLGELRPAPEFTDQDRDWRDAAFEETAYERDPGGWAWRGGDTRAEGRLWGGCLEVLDTVLAADRTMPPVQALDGAVLFLETSEELPAVPEVQRMVLALGERGVLGAVDAVLVGRSKARNVETDPGPEARERFRQEQYDAVTDLVGEYAPDAPVVCGVDVGHTHPTAPLPVGGRCVVDPAAERIDFE